MSGDWQPIETMPKGARVEGDLGGGRTVIGRTVPRSKFGDHNTVTDKNGFRHVVYRWRPAKP
jgi:hypothetical protein